MLVPTCTTTKLGVAVCPLEIVRLVLSPTSPAWPARTAARNAHCAQDCPPIALSAKPITSATRQTTPASVRVPAGMQVPTARASPAAPPASAATPPKLNALPADPPLRNSTSTATPQPACSMGPAGRAGTPTRPVWRARAASGLARCASRSACAAAARGPSLSSTGTGVA